MTTDQIEKMDPIQCHLWTLDLSNAPILTDNFDTVEVYKDTFETDADHRERSLLRCKQCGQLYFYEWLEWIDWNEGNDPTYSTYIPLSSTASANKLKTLSSLELLKSVPRIERNYPADATHATMRWVKQG